MIDNKHSVEYSIDFRTEQSLHHLNSKVCRYGIGKVSGDVVMIIGDVTANPENLTQAHYKCWTNANRNKSPYFLHAALNLTKEPFCYYLTNAKKTTSFSADQHFLTQEINTLDPIKIFVLGDMAEKRVKKLYPFLKYTKIYHPSYIRRFNKMTTTEYAKLLDNE